MSPGRLDQVTAKVRCRYCGGWDMGGIGQVHHTATCTRNTCRICEMAILPGEDRAAGRPPRHLDCAIELEAQLDEDHR